MYILVTRSQALRGGRYQRICTAIHPATVSYCLNGSMMIQSNMILFGNPGRMSVSSQMSKTGHGVEKQFEKETEEEATKDYCWEKKGTIYTEILRVY